MSAFTNIQFTNPARVKVGARLGAGRLFLTLDQDDAHFTISGDPVEVRSLLDEAYNEVVSLVEGLIAGEEPKPEPPPYCVTCGRGITYRRATKADGTEGTDPPAPWGWADDGSDGVPFFCPLNMVNNQRHQPPGDG